MTPKLSSLETFGLDGFLQVPVQEHLVKSSINEILEIIFENTPPSSLQITSSSFREATHTPALVADDRNVREGRRTGEDRPAGDVCCSSPPCGFSFYHLKRSLSGARVYSKHSWFCWCRQHIRSHSPGCTRRALRSPARPSLISLRFFDCFLGGCDV